MSGIFSLRQRWVRDDAYKIPPARQTHPQTQWQLLLGPGDRIDEQFWTKVASYCCCTYSSWWVCRKSIIFARLQCFNKRYTCRFASVSLSSALYKYFMNEETKITWILLWWQRRNCVVVNVAVRRIAAKVVHAVTVLCNSPSVNETHTATCIKDTSKHSASSPEDWNQPGSEIIASMSYVAATVDFWIVWINLDSQLRSKIPSNLIL